MHTRMILSVILGLTLAGTAAQAGTWSNVSWASDATLSNTLQGTQSDYTHLIEFVGASAPFDDVAGVTITNFQLNPIQFTAREIDSVNFSSMGTTLTGADINSLKTYTITGGNTLNTFHGQNSTPPSGSNSDKLEAGSLYQEYSSGNNGDFTIKLDGLTQNTTYRFYLFHSFSGAFNRPYVFDGSDDGTGTTTLNFNGSNSSQLVMYEYNTGSATNFTMTLDYQPVSGSYPMHIYAFGNYAIIPEPSALALVGLGLLTTFVITRRRHGR